jgi:endonuclease YncB( thermonuclease family)
MAIPKSRTPAVLFLTLFALLTSLSCTNAQPLICTRVVDGDTIILSNGEKVRLIGVDTPETVRPNTPVEYYGKEASTFMTIECRSREIRASGLNAFRRNETCRISLHLLIHPVR